MGELRARDGQLAMHPNQPARESFFKDKINRRVRRENLDYCSFAYSALAC